MDRFINVTDDRFGRGIVAGAAAGAFGNILSFIFYALNVTELRLVDFQAIIIYGRMPLVFSEVVFALVAQLAFSAFFGVLFAYWIAFAGSKNYLLKGWFFASTVWYLTYSVFIMSILKELQHMFLSTAMSNHMISSAYGLVLARVLFLLDRENRPLNISG